MKDLSSTEGVRTIGIDLGDRHSRYCVLDAAGKVVEEDSVLTCREGFEAEFGKRPHARVVMEAGSHSPWASRLVKELGHEVLVANPRKLRLIYQSDRKNDKVDARSLARVGRMDPDLLAPIQHRGEQAQVDLALIRSRDAMVRLRTGLINHVRGSVKAIGGRIPSSSSGAFPKLAEYIPREIWPAVSPTINTIGALTVEIRKYDRLVEELAKTKYPETARLRQVGGVGALTAVAYVLTIDDPARLENSRQAGAFLGLQPRQDQSGDTSRQLGITKAGDTYMRRLMVSSAQYILGPFGSDCDLRRWGLELAKRGGKNAKRRAVIAVARKLAVLLHRLWVTGETYEPLRNSKRQKKPGHAAADPTSEGKAKTCSSTATATA